MTTTPTASTRPAGPVRSALLVEDDEMMAELITDLLRDVGVGRVSTASDGLAGLAQLERTASTTDLVVCDLNMPRCDGFEFMEKLAERKFAGRVLLVSGMNARTMNSASLMARFHRLNVIGSLQKPLTRAALTAALKV